MNFKKAGKILIASALVLFAFNMMATHIDNIRYEIGIDIENERADARNATLATLGIEPNIYDDDGNRVGRSAEYAEWRANEGWEQDKRIEESYFVKENLIRLFSFLSTSTRAMVYFLVAGLILYFCKD